VHIDRALGGFARSYAPLLADGVDAHTLDEVQRSYTPDGLVTFLAWPDEPVVRAALRCLAVFGRSEHCRYVATLLHHTSDRVAALAENALWSIWMRAGSPWGVQLLKHAIDTLASERVNTALELLAGLTLAEPAYAEAHHQRGLALSALEQFEPAAEAFRQSLRLNPYHFAAAAGAGLAMFEVGHLRRARDYYRLALKIHPRLANVQEMLVGLEAALGETRHGC
jgi:tetratricopeptide (TPR) repeat protein